MELWQYCTPEQCREFLLSLDLLDGLPLRGDRALKCLYALSNDPERHYRTVFIPKRGGGRRTLREPDPILKRVQKNILRHILDARSVSPYAYAYRRGMGIKENAAVHLGQPAVLKMDIRDFFDSITFPMVKKSAFPDLNFPPSVGTLLASLCCFRDRLPQGAPTSAAISNLVLEPFDRYMGAWCGERNIRYSRYCDDLTFSGEICGEQVTAKARGFLEDMGFELNRRKTRLMRAGRRQTVTGLVVNERLQAPRDYRRRLRQEIYFCERYGVADHLRAREGREVSQGEALRYLESLLGQANYLLSVDPASSGAAGMREKIGDMIKKQLEI